MALGTILGIIAFIAAIWVIYDVLANNKRLSDGMKVLWVICAIFFSIITAAVYYIVGRNNKYDLFRKGHRIISWIYKESKKLHRSRI